MSARSSSELGGEARVSGRGLVSVDVELEAVFPSACGDASEREASWRASRVVPSGRTVAPVAGTKSVDAHSNSRVAIQKLGRYA
jgi:hypothetical protein